MMTTPKRQSGLLAGLMGLGALSVGLSSLLISPNALSDDPPSEACLNNPHATICGDEIVDPTLSANDFYPSSSCVEIKIISSSSLWDLRIKGSSSNCNQHNNFLYMPNSEYGIDYDREKRLMVPVGGSVKIEFERGGESAEPSDIIYSNIGSKPATIRCEDTYWDWGECSFNGNQFEVDHTNWKLSSRNRLSAASYDADGRLGLSQCIDYKGGGVYERTSCFDIRHFFYYDENTRKLQMKHRSWGGDWNPWNLSGGACFGYRGAGEFGTIACDDDPGSWTFLDNGRLKYYANPWGKRGGACLNFYDTKFSFYDCEEPTVGTPPALPEYPELDYDSLNAADKLNAYFALLAIDSFVKNGTEITLDLFDTNSGTYAVFVHHYGVDEVMELYHSGKVDISGGLQW